jgi:hypothetical protein
LSNRYIFWYNLYIPLWNNPDIIQWNSKIIVIFISPMYVRMRWKPINSLKVLPGRLNLRFSFFLRWVILKKVQLFEVQSFDFWSHSKLGPILSWAFRCQFFEVQYFEVQSLRFSRSMLGLSTFSRRFAHWQVNGQPSSKFLRSHWQGFRTPLNNF